MVIVENRYCLQDQGLSREQANKLNTTINTGNLLLKSIKISGYHVMLLNLLNLWLEICLTTK